MNLTEKGRDGGANKGWQHRRKAAGSGTPCQQIGATPWMQPHDRSAEIGGRIEDMSNDLGEDGDKTRLIKPELTESSFRPIIKHPFSSLSS